MNNYETKRGINGTAVNKNTGILHLVQLDTDNKIVRILCNIESSNLVVGKEKSKRKCRRCWTIWDGTAHGNYDYSKTTWGR